MLDRSELPILVVDDEEPILELASAILKQGGFKRITKAGSAGAALEALALPQTRTPDTKTVAIDEPGIALVDVMLMSESGFELCKKIKAAHPSTMVLMISGFDIEGLKEKLVDSEADDFLTKPFKAEELLARIELLAAKLMRTEAKKLIAPGASPAAVGGNRIPHIGDYIGDYMILDSLGWGKNSVVYKAVRKGESETCAIKLLTKYSMEFKDVVKRFEEERKIMSALSHPHLIKFIETGIWDGCPYIVMECVRGINLEERLVSSGIPTPGLAIKAADQLASALNAVHKAGVVHRDIKLKNIMFEPDTSSFKLTDFGIARLMEGAPGITCDGFIVGTPLYMAPEIFRGENATIESDIYSYGTTIYHFTTGAPPFNASRNSELYKKHLTEKPKPLHAYNLEIPLDFDKLIVEKCMAKSPEDRPKSMIEILGALDKIKNDLVN